MTIPKALALVGYLLSALIGGIGGRVLLVGLALSSSVAQAAALPSSFTLVWDEKVDTDAGPLIPLPANKIPSEAQVREIQQDLANALQFYRSIGMPEPPLPTWDGEYVAFLSMTLPGMKDGAAFTAPLNRLHASHGFIQKSPKGSTAALVLQYENYFEDPAVNSGLHPRKSRITNLHELFHAFAWTIPRPSWENLPYPGDWIGEGLTDAIAPFAFGSGRGAWSFYRGLRSGDLAMGKTLGLRPYDYPLDLSELPKQRSWLYTRAPDMRGNEAGTLKIFSYMTSSFWRFLMKESHTLAAANSPRSWRQMRAILAEPLRAEDKTRERPLVAWLDRWIEGHHPVWKTQGLYGAFPAFVAHWVEFPDQWMNSRQGTFEHSRWLDVIFHDGCKRVQLNEQSPAVGLDLEIRPIAATCLVLQWTGERLPESGWPTINVNAHPHAGAGADRQIEALRALHLGTRGATVGHGPIYVDRGRGTAHKAWSSVVVDPLNPKATRGEAVLVFSNVSAPAHQTKPRSYSIRLGVEIVHATGSLTRPAEPESQRPASTAKPKRTTRQARPARRMTDPTAESASLMIGDLSSTEALDCANATLKLSSAATGGFGIAREQEAPDAGAVVQRACAKMVDQLADFTGFAALAANGLQLELVLPAIRSGRTGSVPGAVVKAYWVDPALNVGLYPSPEVRAQTENVNLVIAESNEAHISGGFSARFDAGRHGVEGTASGEFLVWRADTDELQFPEDPIQMMSSDYLIAMAAQGLDIAAIRERAIQQRQAAGPSRGSVSGHRVGDDCQCSCAEFGAFATPPPASRARCASACGNFPGAHQCVVEHETRSGRPAAETHAAINACPSRCADLREGRVSPLCREALWSLYAGCSTSGAVTDAEIREWIGWMVRDIPEPQKSELREATQAQLREADAETRERWVETMRQARHQQESD